MELNLLKTKQIKHADYMGISCFSGLYYTKNDKLFIVNICNRTVLINKLI